MPAKTCNDAIAVALMFDFQHHAFVRLVRHRHRLCPHTVETPALKASKPVRGYAAITRCRSQVNRCRRGSDQRFEFAAPLFERLAAQVSFADTKQVKEHEGRRSLFGQKIHARRGRMESQL